MKIVSLQSCLNITNVKVQSWEKFQHFSSKTSRGYTVFSTEVFDCWRVDKGDTWRDFFGISAENWVNLYSKVLHLGFRAFRNRAICKNFGEWRKPQQLTNLLAAIKHLLVSCAKITNKLWPFSRVLQQKIITHTGPRVGRPSSVWSFLFRLKLQGKYLKLQQPRQQRWPRWFWLISVEKIQRFMPFYALRFGCKDLLLGKHLLQKFEQKFLELQKKWRVVFFLKESGRGTEGTKIIWKWSWRYESQTGLGTVYVCNKNHHPNWTQGWSSIVPSLWIDVQPRLPPLITTYFHGLNYDDAHTGIAWYQHIQIGHGSYHHANLIGYGSFLSFLSAVCHRLLQSQSSSLNRSVLSVKLTDYKSLLGSALKRRTWMKEWLWDVNTEGFPWNVLQCVMSSQILFYADSHHHIFKDDSKMIQPCHGEERY